MEVIWQGEAGNSAKTAFRLILSNEGLLFQRRSAEEPEWTDADEPSGLAGPWDSLFAI